MRSDDVYQAFIGNLLENQFLHFLLLLLDTLQKLLLPGFQIFYHNLRVGWEADPLHSFILLLGNNVHGDQHIEGIVNATTDVLLVLLLNKIASKVKYLVAEVFKKLETTYYLKFSLIIRKRQPIFVFGH